MFESYLDTERRIDGRKTLLLVLSVALHAAAVALMVFFALFHVEELPEPQVMVTFFSAPPPPPPPPPPPAPARAVTRTRPRVVAPKPEDVQPPDKPPPKTEAKPEEPEQPAAPAGDPRGQPGGVPGGMPGGVPGGMPSRRPPPEPAKPIYVKHEVVEKLKLAGDMPQYVPAARMARVQGVVIVKTCLKLDGTVDAARTLILKGIPVMDAEVLAKVRNWRYKPYLVDGKPVAVCFPVRFIFSLER